MAIEIGKLLKKGFTPLVANKFAAVSWQGETLGEFWMWNGQFTNGSDGRFIQTVKVSDLKEASIRFWRDNWVPLRWDQGLLRRMEECLRCHRGFKAQGVVFQDGSFLKGPEAIPDEYLTPGLKKFMSTGSWK